MTLLNDSFKKQLISLGSFEQKLKSIEANKQLLIIEAGPTEQYKSEFIKGFVKNTDRALNENRIIILPNKYGLDGIDGITKGPINSYITSIDTNTNIFDLFDDKKRKRFVMKLKKDNTGVIISKKSTLTYST